MRNQIDLKRLRYILEVARAESITTAAETLSLTQPALTRAIADVEAVLKSQLFHRRPRGVQLTTAGQRFASRARRLVSDMDDLVADMRESSNRLTGRLRLGVTPTAAWRSELDSRLFQLLRSVART